MIAHLRGEVARVSTGSVVIEVGGVGLTVACTPQTALALRPGQEVSLDTTLVVREESLTLFGFMDADQRDVFEAVQTVSGVGPRTALALLATLSPDELRSAISHEDIARLTKVPGIGRKGAERLIVELRDRLGPPRGSVTAVSDGQDWREAVGAGLQSLGWSSREADSAVSAVADQAGDSPDVAALLRAALRSLDRA